MASPAFRQKANAGGATGANVTCNVPAGTADNDILLFFMSKDATGAVTDVAGTWNVIANATANSFHMYIAWKRAASEPASYTFNFASTWRDCIMLAYSGAVVGENPLDPDAPTAPTEGTVATGSQTFATPTDITTTVDTTAVAFCNYIAISSFGAVPGGYTFRQNAAGNEVGVADLVVATASTIGAATFNISGSGGAVKGFQLALQSVAAGGASLPPGLGPAVQMTTPLMMPPP